MKNEDILKAMTDISDEYIEEAAGDMASSADAADGWTTVQLPPADPARAKTKRRSGRRWLKWAGGIAAALAVCVIGGSFALNEFGWRAGSSESVMSPATPAPQTTESFHYVDKNARSGAPSFGTSATDLKEFDADYGIPEEGYAMEYPAEAAASSSAAGVPMASGEGSANAAMQNVKMIYRANVSLQTTDFQPTTEELEKLVDSLGGYYESSYTYNGGYYENYVNYNGQYTVRIPADSYRTFIRILSDQFYVTDLNESVEDVGTHYFELESRLRTLRTKEERLQQLLKEAATMSDIIDLENALSDTQYQIDMYTTDLNRYDSLIGYSTVSIYIDQVEKPSGAITETPTFGERISKAFENGSANFVRGLQNFAIGVTYDIFNILLFLVIAVVLFFVIRSIVKKHRKKSQR